MSLGESPHDIHDTAPRAALLQQLRQGDRALPEALQAQMLAAGSASIPGLALIGFQGRGRDEVVQSDFYHDLFLQQYSGQNLDCHAIDGAVVTQFFIKGTRFFQAPLGR